MHNSLYNSRRLSASAGVHIKEARRCRCFLPPATRIKTSFALLIFFKKVMHRTPGLRVTFQPINIRSQFLYYTCFYIPMTTFPS